MYYRVLAASARRIEDIGCPLSRAGLRCRGIPEWPRGFRCPGPARVRSRCPSAAAADTVGRPSPPRPPLGSQHAGTAPISGSGYTRAIIQRICYLNIVF